MQVIRLFPGPLFQRFDALGSLPAKAREMNIMAAAISKRRAVTASSLSVPGIVMRQMIKKKNQSKCAICWSVGYWKRLVTSTEMEQNEGSQNDLSRETFVLKQNHHTS